MKAKKAAAVILALALAVSFAACTFSARYRNETVNAKIMSIRGSNISLLVMDLSLGEVETRAALVKPHQNTTDAETSEGAQIKYYRATVPQPSGSQQEMELSQTQLSAEAQSDEEITQETTGIPVSVPADETFTLPELPTDEEGDYLNPPPKMRESTTGYSYTGVSFTVDISDVTVMKNSVAISADELHVGDDVRIVFDSSGSVVSFEVVTNLNNDPYLYQRNAVQGNSAYTIGNSRKMTGVRFFSNGDDENALRIDCAIATVDSSYVVKQSGISSSEEYSESYGMNAAVLVTNFSTATLVGLDVSCHANNSGGVFSFGKKTAASIWNSEIVTSGNSSCGVCAAGGGIINMSDVDISTSGYSAPAIRTGHGGAVNAADVKLVTSGQKSPAVYVTDRATLRDSLLFCSASPVVSLEGNGKLSLQNCSISADGDNGVFVFGASEEKNSSDVCELSVYGGTIGEKAGKLFSAVSGKIRLLINGVKLEAISAESDFLCAKGASDVELIAENQTLEGRIDVTDGSKLKMTLRDSSEFSGQILTDFESESETVLTVGEGCTLNLSGDCTLTRLDCKGTVNYNGFTVTLCDGTVLGNESE